MFRMRELTQPAASRGNGKSVGGAGRAGAPARGTIAIASVDGLMRQLKTSESVARDIVRDIVEQAMVTGDSLPSEAAMLEQYGVSRESLREALRLLEVQGLISIRRGPGGGPIVGTVDPANLGRVSTLFFFMAGATYRELFEAWVIGESVLAEMAARNPNVEARQAAMVPYLAGAPNNTTREVEEFVEHHVGFHAVIGSLANNRVLELTMQVYGKTVSHHVAVVNDPRALREVIAADHHRIAQAIAAGHHNRARELMVSHIQTVADFTTEALGERADDYIEWL